jgi:hypothetical protein
MKNINYDYWYTKFDEINELQRKINRGENVEANTNEFNKLKRLANYAGIALVEIDWPEDDDDHPETYWEFKDDETGEAI